MLAEPVLATATGRIRWGLSHISVAVGGAGLLLAAAGLSTGLGYGILTGSVSTQVPRLLGAAVVRLIAVLVLAAVAVLVFGLLPWESIALVWLCGIALALGVAGLLGLRHRDLGDFGPSGLAARIRTYIEESSGG